LKLAIAAIVFCGAIPFRVAAGNTLATWTDTTGSSTWENPANWDINQVPNNSGYDVRLSIADPCNLSSVFQIGALTLSPNSATLNLLPASSLAIASPSGIGSDGTITVNSGATLRFDTHTGVTGTGQISLKGGTISADGFSVTNGAGHAISGFGDLVFVANFAALINNGLIFASSSLSSTGATLHLFLSDSAVNQNKGMMQSYAFSLPTKLILEKGRIYQPPGGKLSGTAFFADSVVQIGNVEPFTISGGTFETRDGPPGKGVIQGFSAVLYGDITNSGAFEIPANGFTRINATTLTNFGPITLKANTSLMRFDVGTSIAGFGAIILTNDALLQISNIGSSEIRVTNGNGHTITGNGRIQIDPGTTLTNNGTITPGTPFGTLTSEGKLQLSYASKLAFEIGGPIQGVSYDHLNHINSAPLILNGKLAVTVLNGFTSTPQASDTFDIITTQAPLEGAFTNVASNGRLNTTDGAGSFQVSYTGSNVVLSNYGPPLPPPRLLNISTRTRVLTGLNALIGGFIVTGGEPKKVMVRGIGPSLANYGLAGSLADPVIELHSGNGGTLIASNDNWKDSQQTEIQNTGIAPTNDLESAIVATLPANNSGYTVVLTGKKRRDRRWPRRDLRFEPVRGFSADQSQFARLCRDWRRCDDRWPHHWSR
jgi:hypothetical protein